jgi:hypothetical protein
METADSNSGRRGRLKLAPAKQDSHPSRPGLSERPRPSETPERDLFREGLRTSSCLTVRLRGWNRTVATL